MRTTTVTKKLRCSLTDAELAEIGTQISDRVLEVEQIEAMKKRINPLKEEITRLSHKFKSGTDERYVECTVWYDMPEDGMKTIMRMDTNEIILREPMTEDEMQGELDFDREEPTQELKQLLLTGEVVPAEEVQAGFEVLDPDDDDDRDEDYTLPDNDVYD